MQMITHKALFGKYSDSVVEQKSIQFAKWTLPQLMVELCSTTGMTNRIERDYQAGGALLVNNLSAKLAALLFPSSRPFYKIKAGKALLEAAQAKGVKKNDLASGLAKLEMDSCQQLFLNASYEQLVMCLKHLIVTGNVLLYRDSQNSKTICYGLNSFRVRRDGRGNLMDCILREYTDFESLPPDIQAVLRTKNPSKYTTEDGTYKTVELYIRIKRGWSAGTDPKVVYVVSQQADDVDVGEPGIYPEHLCPWQAPTWSMIAGENYGRGLVEDYGGGFAKLSDLSLAATLYQCASAKVVNLVAPGQGADIDELNDAENGEYVSGTKDSVSTFEGGDARKSVQMAAEIEAVFGQLARAFMYKANTRNAERVTAFELKQDALEAENALGGAYSSLSASLQVPLAHVLLTEVSSEMLEGLLTESVKLDIMAGIPALGRQAEVQNLAAAAQDAGAIIPTLSQIDPRIDKQRIMDVILSGQSVDPSTVMFDEDQLAKQAIAAKQQAQGESQINNAQQLSEATAAQQGIQG